jgi:cytochrome d ubiquinol oxidase subunit II
MSLDVVPMVFVLVGLVFYVVLAGADFGAALWPITAGPGEDGVHLRDHSHHAMAPVWEANHVWLIFVLTVLWTAYPPAFGSIASTAAAALFLAGVGIIIRGAAYALRTAATTRKEMRRIDAASAVASFLTPFALGAVVGGIASGRIPVGNAEGDLLTSWLNPTSVLVGAVAVATSAYMAAVFLAADAVRLQEPDLAERFRLRALVSAVVAGALAIAGLVVLHEDAHRVYRGLVAGDGRIGLAVSVVAGAGTLLLVIARRFTPARFTAGVAVAGIVAGWALAQQPVILPGLTISEAAAPRDTLVAIVVAVLAGGAIVFPSLALLFQLTLAGRLGHGGGGPPAADEPRAAAELLAASAPGLAGRIAAACLIAALGLLTIAEATWAHIAGSVAIVGFIAAGVLAAVPPEASPARSGSHDDTGARPPRVDPHAG